MKYSHKRRRRLSETDKRHDSYEQTTHARTYDHTHTSYDQPPTTHAYCIMHAAGWSV